MRLCVASSLDEFAQIRFARLERNIGQLSPKQLIPQPDAIGVNDIGLAVICDPSRPAMILQSRFFEKQALHQ
jgi:hypothetical protein